jgi:hypothetical protein
LATPFVEVQHADFGDEPDLVRTALVIALWMLSWVLTKAFFPIDPRGFLSLVFRVAKYVCHVADGTMPDRVRRNRLIVALPA